MTITARRAGPGIPADPKDHARQIANAVCETWFQQYHGDGLEVPLAVTAVLTLTGMYTASGPGLADVLPQLDRGRFTELIQRCALEWSINRPDLVPATQPVFGWLTGVETVAGIDEQTIRAVHSVGAAAMRAGVLQYGRDPQRRRVSDLLGTLLQVMRSRRSRSERGQFFTPEEVTKLQGRLVQPQPGQSVMDPAAGSGRMLLGAADAMRELDLDPTTVTWWANDIDPVAAALCGVNADLWDLGPRVVIGCGNGLLDRWADEALARRQAAIDEWLSLVRIARQMALLRDVLGLAVGPDPLMAHLARLRMPPAPPPPHSSTFDAETAFRQGRLF